MVGGISPPRSTVRIWEMVRSRGRQEGVQATDLPRGFANTPVLGVKSG